MDLPNPDLPTLPTLDLAELERIAIGRALAQTHGNRVRAAELLGIHVRTLHRKLRAAEAEATAAARGKAATVAMRRIAAA